MEKGNKKVIRGWVMYDWANSVYNLVISSAIFPIYYNSITTQRFLEQNGWESLPDGVDVTVDFLGMTVSSTALMSFTMSASFLVVSILSPMLSGIADISGNKKSYMRFFNYLGVASCISLFWFKDVPIEIGILFTFFASIGFWNSLVFYNAYLPEIADPKDHDKISARGYSMGYFGSMILLIICLAIIMFTGENGSNTAYSFILVGVWWLVFSQITYSVLPKSKIVSEKVKGKLWKGFKELKSVMVEFGQTKRLKRYLFSFFFFNTGVQTVMVMAVYFADKEISWPENDNGTGLIISILLIQILGALGAFLMSKLSKSIGNVKTLGISISIWIGICIGAYFVKTPSEFYLLASCVGLVMGGVQAIARSTYSKFLPANTTSTASYFSFYDATEKVGMVFGLFCFGFLQEAFGSIRFSVVSVAVFFIIGFILLLFIPKHESIKQ